MELNSAQTDALSIYQHLIRLIVPRPIAWVSTISTSGRTNLAPFSFFSGVGSKPPSLLFCPANRRDGTMKDTMRNVVSQGEFVVNIVSEDVCAVMNQTAAELPEEESEFQTFGVAEAPSVVVRPPRVAGSPAQLECRLMQMIRLGEGGGAANIIIGEIVHLAIRDSVLDARGYADPEKMQVVGRMGGSSYCRTGDRFELKRP
ncbi:MAG: flavin reductase family protein [Planctomyces sp.]|nr:flavin reductase family protein [Planctomyces sp.]